MEQNERFDRLPLACHDEAEEPTQGSLPSSPESSPIMTPETSEDEDEDGLHLPEAEDESHWWSSDEDTPLLDMSSSAPEHRSRDLHYTSTATAQSSGNNEGEDLRVAPDITPEESNDGSDPFYTHCDVLDSSEDEDDDFHDALLGSEICYGVLISPIRKEDREALEKVNFATAESRSRMRIYRELRSLHEDETVPYISVTPINGKLGNCLACFEGAPETPYEGGIFWLHIDFPRDYPSKAPTITFLTPVYHPNIDAHGRICIDILEKAWSPCLQTQTLLLSILSVLHAPIVDNRDEVLVSEIGEKYLKDNGDYCDIVRVYTANANGSRPDTSNLVNLEPIEYNPSQSAHLPTQPSLDNQ